MTLGEETATLYRDVLSSWNGRDATGFGALFDARGSIVGFDGSCVETPDEITRHLAEIFADHTPARYVSKLREIRPLGADGALLRAVVGMVPPGQDDVEPELNAVQVLVAVRTDAGFRVAHFQSTPARLDGRPDEVASLTDELHAVLRGEA